YSYDKFISSFPIKINESGTGFSAFIKMAPISNVMTKKNQDRYAQWRLVSIKAVLSYELDETEGRKIFKAHKTFDNAQHDYVAEEIQWLSTQSAPSSMTTMWFFGTASGLTKDTKIGKILFESTIQYKEIVVDQVNTIINNQYQFFGNGEVAFEDNNRDQTPGLVKIAFDQIAIFRGG
ncbi:10978_t:CDS:2, partial [Racocetra persica]